jgi:hypothetical protein
MNVSYAFEAFCLRRSTYIDAASALNAAMIKLAYSGTGMLDSSR